MPANPVAELPSEPLESIPSLTVDCVIFGLSDKRLKTLLVKHAIGDSKGEWGLPGGVVYTKESLEEAASRMLGDLTGVQGIYMEQLQAFGDVERAGSEKRVITLAFFALVQPEHYELAISSDASDAIWCDVKERPELIFDHDKIVDVGIAYLRRRIRYKPIGVNLLPAKFTLGQLQELYEAILDEKLDKPNFRRKMLRINFLVCCNETQDNVPHRAGVLYRFDQENYDLLCDKGFSFEF
ncbi:MAG: NUDIX hydrolase [Alteromonadaceae bacterium]|nr:MAG: NUDIX hydrolase [Alteromonadaceae bacterium]